jgi:hypothetical protein
MRVCVLSFSRTIKQRVSYSCLDGCNADQMCVCVYVFVCACVCVRGFTLYCACNIKSVHMFYRRHLELLLHLTSTFNV